MESKYLLLSYPISEKTPTYGNRDNVLISPNSSVEKGDTANSFSISITTNHMGTHIDFPLHFYKCGKSPLDVDLSYWFFKDIGMVDIKCNPGEIISYEHLEKSDIDRNIEILLIRTGFEKYRQSDYYWQKNPGVSPELADYLRVKFPNLRTIGFDFISLTSFQHSALGKEAHLSFLNEKNKFISIIEDMKIANCNKKLKELIISPLFINEIDSAPVTIFGKIKD